MGPHSGALPRGTHPKGRAGRKPVLARAVLEAVLLILNTGAQWHMLPQCYPNYKTVLREILTQLANTLREEGAIDERESFINAAFASAKGGGDGSTRRGKGVKILAIVDRHGHPLSVSTRLIIMRSPWSNSALASTSWRPNRSISLAIAPTTAMA